ncbi:MAG: enolase C-terminal domain-like protein [Hyphomicrobiales bacterium]
MLTSVVAGAPVERLDVAAYVIPTDAPEADGTFAWRETTLVTVTLRAGGETGFGYSYADVATARLIATALRDAVTGADAMDIPAAWTTMVHRIRNLGRPGIASMAISAVDVALWDLKAKLLHVSLAALLGQVRDGVPLYGSGGFTSYSDGQLRAQLGGWAGEGLRMVKMKVGTKPEDDVHRVAVAREAIGDGAALFVDANGAYTRKQALAFAEQFAEYGVSWFEEPVSSDDLEGLRLVRDRAQAGMDIAAGEYGYDAYYFRRMVEAGAVDVLQADASRCGGITGFLGAGRLCEAWGIPLSSHCAPALHLAVCGALPAVRHMEYFHDHVRIERMLFEGVPEPRDGLLRPDLSRPGLGIEFRAADAARYAVEE